MKSIHANFDLIGILQQESCIYIAAVLEDGASIIKRPYPSDPLISNQVCGLLEYLYNIRLIYDGQKKDKLKMGTSSRDRDQWGRSTVEGTAERREPKVNRCMSHVLFITCAHCLHFISLLNFIGELRIR